MLGIMDLVFEFCIEPGSVENVTYRYEELINDIETIAYTLGQYGKSFTYNATTFTFTV